ncbi:hypothetical protein GJ744_009492 [Endocarpon pusillum]|uniref:AHC1-like C2H2 zinc-finger domain-containing protein n=1 Tax=Endocarpon pusillum TaxID=364733 RepID=A0A8H7E4F2_9EURO|nr:hypothetical protein GJ744_009492 [Endocarpon pusillum]
MLRLLSWSSGLAADKITSQEVNYFAPQRHRSPTRDLQKSPVLKRKRVGSGEVHLSRRPNKRRMERPPQVFVPTNPTLIEKPLAVASPARNEMPVQFDLPRKVEQTKMDYAQPVLDAPTTVRMKPDKQTLRQTLSSQISLEILLKHNELRLIDQEIAKCQIALEQLRRCAEIPYPVTGLSQNVSQGLGPAVRSSGLTVQPESPAPWCVTDGPYTRHYAKWLLPDPLFDGGDVPGNAGLNTPAGKTPTKGRSTRGSFADSSTAAGKSKAQRAGKFHALSSGYPQPKDKAGPMVQKRKSDGLLVKLVCLDCRRDNFSSAQGFINHCRIAHSRNFASHDAAADACGEPVDVDEAGAVIGGEGSAGSSTTGLVHPLIYTALLPKQESPKKSTDPRPTSAGTGPPDEQPLKSSVGDIAEHSLATRLTPSPLTPNLSCMMQRKGVSLDLQGLVADMKTSVPVDDPSESEGEGDEDSKMADAPPLGRHLHLTGSMQPARSTATVQPDSPSGSRKGAHKSRTLRDAADQRSLPPVPAAVADVSTSHPCVPPLHGNELESSPTNEINQAPSLVDDDGDDDCEAHSPSYSTSCSIDTENRELDFEVEDGDEGGPSTRNRATESDYTGTAKHHPPPAPPRRASAFRRSISGREEKHVSFVSPSPAREAEPSKKAGGRKRRRTGTGP